MKIPAASNMVKAGNVGKLVIPGMFLNFSGNRLIRVKETRIDVEYGNNLSFNLLSFGSSFYVLNVIRHSQNYLRIPYILFEWFF